MLLVSYWLHVNCDVLQVSKELGKDSVVVFDEAHNIDNVLIESMSVYVQISPSRCAGVYHPHVPIP